MPSQLIASCAIILLALLAPGAFAAERPFPYGQELLLDAEPMRPGKRMPILTIESNGDAKIDLWCRTVPARIELSESGIRIEAGSLPQELPEMQSAGQCTPERIRADEQMLAVLAEVTGWRWENGAIMLLGPTTMTFRAATN